MGTILKIISAVYLVVIGLGLAVLVLASFAPVNPLPPNALVIAIALALGLALPAIALYAFGSITEDIRAMNRNIVRLVQIASGNNSGQL
jgi:hypothetical protein